MSLPRSIDRADLGGATVNLTLTTETLVLVGPALQTPKDTSIVVCIAAAQVQVGTSGTGITLKIRQGTTGTGPVIGIPFTQPQLAGSGASAVIMVSSPANFTDYVQWCLTCTQIAATANGVVNGATMLCLSF